MVVPRIVLHAWDNHIASVVQNIAPCSWRDIHIMYVAVAMSVRLVFGLMTLVEPIVEIEMFYI